jgi:hypothetical protein
LIRFAIGQRVHLHELQDLVDAPLLLRAIDLAHLKAKSHILAHAHVRPQRVALKAHDGVALVRLQRGHVAVIEEDATLVGVVQAGDQAQQRALAAAAGSEQEEQFTRLDFQVDVIEGDGGAEAFGDVIEPNSGHRGRPF